MRAQAPKLWQSASHNSVLAVQAELTFSRRNSALTMLVTELRPKTGFRMLGPVCTATTRCALRASSAWKWSLTVFRATRLATPAPHSTSASTRRPGLAPPFAADGGAEGPESMHTAHRPRARSGSRRMPATGERGTAAGNCKAGICLVRTWTPKLPFLGLRSGSDDDVRRAGFLAR